MSWEESAWCERALTSSMQFSLMCDDHFTWFSRWLLVAVMKMQKINNLDSKAKQAFVCSVLLFIGLLRLTCTKHHLLCTNRFSYARCYHWFCSPNCSQPAEHHQPQSQNQGNPLVCWSDGMLRQRIGMTGSLSTLTPIKKLATYNEEMHLSCDTRPDQKQLCNDVLTDQSLFNSNIGCDQLSCHL